MAHTLLDQKRAVRFCCPALLAMCTHRISKHLNLSTCHKNSALPNQALGSWGRLGLQGKVLLLITNSDYQYTDRMMSHAYDRYLKTEGMTWRDLFDMACLLPSTARCTWLVIYT